MLLWMKGGKRKEKADSPSKVQASWQALQARSAIGTGISPKDLVAVDMRSSGGTGK